MSAAFTPGPWEFVYERYEKRIPIRQGGFEFPAYPLGWVDSDDVDPAEAKANASLIAAAPDLYRELRNAVVLLRAAGVKETDQGTIRGAEAALAKARGEV